MQTARIYLKDLKEKANSFILSKENSKILKSVLRLKKGNNFDIVDGEGTLGNAIVEKFSRDGCHVKILRKTSYTLNVTPVITLAQAFPKGKRIDYVIQKAVELGVDRIIFFSAKRCVSAFKKSELNIKLKRFEKIAVEALRQCKRVYLPEIKLESNLNTCLEDVSASDLKLCFHEHEKGTPLKSWLNQFDSPREITFAIGPEGGFTDNEVVSFVSAGFKQVKLGEEVLRTETAPVSVLSILNYIYRWG